MSQGTEKFGTHGAESQAPLQPEQVRTPQVNLWTWLLVITLAALVVLVMGAYALDWTWTGFHGNKLWDWLNLLLLPVALTAITVWFTAQQSSDSDTASGQQVASPPPYLVRGVGTVLQLKGDILKMGRARDNNI